MEVPTSTSFSLGASMSSSPLNTLPQPIVTGPLARASTIAPVLVVFSLDLPAFTCVVHVCSAGGPLSAIILFSVDFGAGSLPGTGAAMDGPASVSLDAAFSALSRSCAVLI